MFLDSWDGVCYPLGSRGKCFPEGCSDSERAVIAGFYIFGVYWNIAMTSEREYDVWGVRFDDKSGWPIIVLKDAENGQCFAIAISALNVYPVLVVTDPQKWHNCGGRPVTQDFTLALVRAGSLRIERLVIDGLTEEGVFTAAVELRSPGGKTSRVDARPSDAIPVALGAGAPIFVADEVIAKVQSFPLEELPYREIRPEDVPGLTHRD